MRRKHWPRHGGLGLGLGVGGGSDSYISDGFSSSDDFTDGLGSIQPNLITPTIISTTRYLRWMTADGKLWAFNVANGLEYSTDGISWTFVLAPPAVDSENQVGIISSTGRAIWSTYDGRVFVSTMDRTSWDAAIGVGGLAFTFPIGYSDQGFGYDVYEAKIFLASYGVKDTLNPPRYIYYSGDGGATWTEIYDGGPATDDTHLHDVAYDPWADRVWACEGDSPHRSIIYCDDYEEVAPTWTKIWPNEDCPYIFTNITAMPNYVIFGSDANSSGIGLWVRPSDPPQPVVNSDDFYFGHWPFSSTGSYQVSVRGWRNDNNFLVLPWVGSGSPGYAGLLITEDGLNFYEIWNGAVGNDSIRNICGPRHDDATRTVWAGGYLSGHKILKWILPTTYYTNLRGANIQWTGATWENVLGIAANTPTLGSELLVDNDFEAWSSGTDLTNYTETISGGSTVNREDADVYEGSYAVRSDVVDGATASVSQSFGAITGPKWFRFECYSKASAVLLAKMIIRAATYVFTAGTEYVKYSMVGRNNATGTLSATLARVDAGDYSLYFDKASLKEIALSSLFRTVQFSYPKYTVEVALNYIKAPFCAGVVTCLNSITSPTDFIFAYYDRLYGKVNAEKCVGGVYTAIITPTTLTYYEGASIQIVRDGTSFTIKYNGSTVDAPATVEDASIVNNHLHGVFSTGDELEVRLDNFLIYAQ